MKGLLLMVTFTAMLASLAEAIPTRILPACKRSATRGSGNLLRLGETCQHGGERDHEKQPFHARLQGIPMCAGSERGARNAEARRLRLKLPHFDTLNAV